MWLWIIGLIGLVFVLKKPAAATTAANPTTIAQTGALLQAGVNQALLSAAKSTSAKVTTGASSLLSSLLNGPSASPAQTGAASSLPGVHLNFGGQSNANQNTSLLAPQTAGDGANSTGFDSSAGDTLDASQYGDSASEMAAVGEGSSGDFSGATVGGDFSGSDIGGDFTSTDTSGGGYSDFSGVNLSGTSDTPSATDFSTPDYSTPDFSGGDGGDFGGDGGDF